MLIGLAPLYPGVWFHALGAVCGGLQGGIGAALSEGDFGDVMLGAGLGAAFGAVVPWGGIGSLAGAMAGYGIAKWAFGNDQQALAQGWEWGGLVGGIGGSAWQGTLSAAKTGASRPLLSGLMSAGPDLLGGGAGAIYGFYQDGTSTSALRWAQIGMMGASLTGAAARGLWSVTRAKGVSSIAGAAQLEGRFAINPRRTRRTGEEAVALAKQLGIEVGDDIRIIPAGWHASECVAWPCWPCGSGYRPSITHESQAVFWQDAAPPNAFHHRRLSRTIIPGLVWTKSHYRVE